MTYITMLLAAQVVQSHCQKKRSLSNSRHLPVGTSEKRTNSQNSVPGPRYEYMIFRQRSGYAGHMTGTSHIITKHGNSIARLLVINTLTLSRVPKIMSTHFSFQFSPMCVSKLLCLKVPRPRLFVPMIGAIVK